MFSLFSMRTEAEANVQLGSLQGSKTHPGILKRTLYCAALNLLRGRHGLELEVPDSRCASLVYEFEFVNLLLGLIVGKPEALANYASLN